MHDANNRDADTSIVFLMKLVMEYRYRLHGTLPEGYEDTWLIEVDSAEELQERVDAIVKIKKLTHYWAENLDA